MYTRLTPVFCLLITTTSCGSISTGGSTSPNDSIPSGKVVAQGQFAGQSGQTVTGSAIIYNMGSSSYIARLSGITAPSEGGLQVWVMGSDGSTPLVQASLRSSTGNQNYSFSSSNASFSSVCIRSTQKSTFYGCAQML